eukprot:scaffold165747_cov27-Tisochrysis_lutea.AAC.8
MERQLTSNGDKWDSTRVQSSKLFSRPEKKAPPPWHARARWRWGQVEKRTSLVLGQKARTKRGGEGKAKK